jgi:hypothetical protein
MKHNIFKTLTVLGMLLFAVGAWADPTVNIKKQLNGAENNDAGTVTPSISQGKCTLTVTPANGNYVTSVTACSIVTGNMAQGRTRGPGFDISAIEVTASPSNTDPSGETKYSFDMPADGSNVEVTVNFLSRKTLTSTMVSDIAAQIYTGAALTPAVTVTDNGNALTEGTHYTVEYSDNVNAGENTAKATITGIGTYTGSVEKYFTIKEKEKDYLSIKDGDAFLSKLRVTKGNSFAIKDFYQVVFPEDIPEGDLAWYSDDTDVASVNNEGVITAEGYGTAAIALAYAGDGKYEEDNYTFYVDAAPKTPVISLLTGAYSADHAAITITKENVDGMAISYTWDDITGDNNATWKNYADEGVAFQAGTLSARVGYTYTYKGITQIVYSDTVSVVYTYLIDIATCTVTGNGDQTYNGSAYTPELTVTPAGGGTALALDTDYMVSYKKGDVAVGSMIDAAIYTIVITAKEGSAYEGSKEVPFTIIPKTIVADWVTLTQETYEYTGEEIKPEVKVKDSDRNVDLTLYVDFDIAYSDNVTVGTATASVTGTGNYTGGPFAKNFEIVNRVFSEQFAEGQTFGTFYSETEAFLLPDNIVAYIITGVNGTTVNTKRISYIPKGVPVLVKKGTSSETATNSAEGNIMLGTTAAKDVTTITGGTVYVLYKDEFVKTISGEIPANRCYLVLAGSAGARSLSISHGDGENTGIREIEYEAMGTEKWYDLQGRRIEKPTKSGLYIVNGKIITISSQNK